MWRRMKRRKWGRMWRRKRMCRRVQKRWRNVDEEGVEEDEECGK